MQEILVEKFGFEEVPKGGSHRYYKLQLKGLPVIQTMFSHGSKDIYSKLESAIANDIRVRT